MRNREGTVAKWFERYTCPDSVVTGLPETLAAVERQLGLATGVVRPNALGIGFDTSHLVVNSDLNLTASTIQLLGLKPLTKSEPPTEEARDVRAMLLAYITARPLYRPIVSHVSSLRVPELQDIDEIAEMLRSRGVPHMQRLGNVYIGLVEDGERIYYDAEVDLGTQLEFAALSYVGMLVPPTMPSEPVLAQLEPGTMVRPTARTHLVENADAVIDRFREMLDWPG